MQMWSKVLIGVLFALLMTQGACGSKERQDDDVPHLTTVAEFDEKVLKSSRPVLVDFYADGCSPCRKLAPVISKLYTEYQGKADVFKVNVKEVAELARKYEIIGWPTVMLFNKSEILKWIGPENESVYRGAIDRALTQ